MKWLHWPVCFLVLASASARSELIGYWDFNGTLDRSAGTSGTLGIEFEGFGVGFEGFGTGTSVNALDGFAAGSARGFYSLGDIDERVSIAVTGLDFTGRTTPVISFAARNDGAFELGDEFFLEYNAGAGWVRVADFADPGAVFGTFSYAFLPGVLDDVSNAGIRLIHATDVTLLNTYEIDNVQIQAVPEPATLVFLGLGFGALAAGRRFVRARRVAVPIAGN